MFHVFVEHFARLYGRECEVKPKKDLKEYIIVLLPLLWLEVECIEWPITAVEVNEVLLVSGRDKSSGLHVVPYEL